MNKKANTAVKVIFGLTLVFAISFIAVAYYYVKAFEHAVNTSKIKRILAEDIQVTKEWTEVKLEQPLESTKDFQEIQFFIANSHTYYIDKREFENTNLSEKTTITPEIEIIEESGKEHRLKKGSKYKNRISFMIGDKIDSFPRDIKFKAIRIRSDNPFKCEKIIWKDFDMK